MIKELAIISTLDPEDSWHLLEINKWLDLGLEVIIDTETKPSATLANHYFRGNISTVTLFWKSIVQKHPNVTNFEKIVEGLLFHEKGHAIFDRGLRKNINLCGSLSNAFIDHSLASITNEEKRLLKREKIENAIIYSLNMLVKNRRVVPVSGIPDVDSAWNELFSDMMIPMDLFNLLTYNKDQHPKLIRYRFMYLLFDFQKMRKSKSHNLVLTPLARKLIKSSTGFSIIKELDVLSS